MKRPWYLVDNGCKWRALPHDFPPYSTVHSFYRRARLSGLWDRILEHLVEVTRKRAKRNSTPSYALIDSQSAKTVYASKHIGYDGGKKTKEESGISLLTLWGVCLPLKYIAPIFMTQKPEFFPQFKLIASTLPSKNFVEIKVIAKLLLQT